MCYRYIFIYLLAIAPCVPIVVTAQDTDSLKTYYFDRITVESGRTPELKMPVRIDPIQMETRDGASFADMGSLLPSAKIQTNSRGEATLYLRGAGERGIMLFFDGIPLNIPWDNRIDLGHIPIEAVDGISVVKGIPSLTYGPNAVSGVVKLVSRSVRTTPNKARFVSRLGENSSRYLSGVYIGGGEERSYLLSASYNSSEGYNLPAGFQSPDNPSRTRVNSGGSSFNLLGRLNYSYGDAGSVGISTSFTDSKKEVPSEIDVSIPRYWRYPLWHRIGMGINGEHRFTAGRGSSLRYSFSGTRFVSQIDQYHDESFGEIIDIEKSLDYTGSGRVVYSTVLTNSSIVRLAASAFSTRHTEQLQSESFHEKRFSQYVMSFAAELEYFREKLSVTTGAGYDRSVSRDGVRTSDGDAVGDYNLVAGAIYSIDRSHSVNISAGRKIRFPTLREAYSGALGRFVPNPDLEAETLYSLETGYAAGFNRVETDVTLFVSYLRNGIVRESLPERQFRRINKAVIRTYGFEFASQYRPGGGLSARFQLTYLTAASKNDAGAFTDTLEYRPQLVSGFQLLYAVQKGIGGAVELNYTGLEFGLREGETHFRKLPGYFLANLRFSYAMPVTGGARIEFFGRVNNLFDKLYFSQWGLPAAGRNFWGGASVEF